MNLIQETSDRDQLFATHLLIYSHIVSLIGEFSGHGFDVLIYQKEYQSLPRRERARYDALSMQICWLIHEYSTPSSHKEGQGIFSYVISWSKRHLYDWLLCNGMFFTNEDFWLALENTDELPIQVTENVHLHSSDIYFGVVDQRIDWDNTHKNYFCNVLSPFHPLMLEGWETDSCRNKLVVVLNKILSRESLIIADFGCGCAEILKYFKTKPKKYVGFDLSSVALKNAELNAINHDIDAEFINTDIKDLNISEKFDLVLSINSLVFPTRQENVECFKNFSQSLKDDGYFILLLPAFEAVTQGISLTIEKITSLFGENGKHRERVRKSIYRKRQIFEDECLFAEDGRHQQSFHTFESIVKLCEENSIHVELIEKVIYPNSISTYFNYVPYGCNHFENWDWLVIGKKN